MSVGGSIMKPILIEDQSQAALKALEKGTDTGNRSMAEEVSAQDEVLIDEADEFHSCMIAPHILGLFTLPYMSEGVPVQVKLGGEYWPSWPITDEDIAWVDPDDDSEG
jgi:hypothetical protein